MSNLNETVEVQPRSLRPQAAGPSPEKAAFSGRNEATLNQPNERQQIPAPNPFDPESLRLGQDFAASVGVKKVLTVVPVRKPKRQEFVRVRPGDEWRLQTAALEDSSNKDIYLVDRSLWNEWGSEIHPVCLVLAMNRSGDLFLWPCKLPGADGRSNSWNDSALQAAKHGESNWIRVVANMQSGLYDVFQASDELPAPEWPEISFKDLLERAFRGRLIQKADHALLKSLRGER